MSRLRYVVISPARNEASYIGATLASMKAQTRPPLRWVIVSDGSTDGTDDLVREQTADVEWVELERLPARRERNFAAKVHAFNAGLARVKHLDFDVVASLDADLSFAPDYFAFLMSQFDANPRLGVAGTPFVEHGTHYDYRFTNIEHVSGACQVFRRQCFEEIGGYVPLVGGGIDWVAVTTARMKGWQTQTFTEMTCQHLRSMGTGASASRVRGLFEHGQKDYRLGWHPLWQLSRGAYQMTRSPYVVGGVYLLAGYCWAALQRRERQIPRELVQFNRAEQMARLRRAVTRLSGLPLRRTPSNTSRAQHGNI